jgi:hypothetical protein
MRRKVLSTFFSAGPLRLTDRPYKNGVSQIHLAPLLARRFDNQRPSHNSFATAQEPS